MFDVRCLSFGIYLGRLIDKMDEKLKDIYKVSQECDSCPRQEDAESEDSTLSPPCPAIKVLLVDDKKLIGRLVGRMLKSEADIEFHYCESARDAMRVANTFCPTVILQDLVMPEIDGLDMVQYFRSKKKTRHTPLIVLSAEEDAKIKAKAFSLGANDYVVKLPDKIELIARIRYHSQAYINMLQRDAAYEALRESKKKVEIEREAVEAERRKIMDSIQYAQMIQSSLLPNPENIKTFFGDSFFILIPKDVVGGDFIFTDYTADGLVIAVIDCTGHGVPGAFMTIVASFGLRKIIKDEGCHEPARILKRLNFFVKTTLQQDTDYALSDDGLDAAICSVRFKEGYFTSLELTFAGARLPLFYVQNKEINVIKGDRQSIGYKKSELNFNFTSHLLNVEKGMSIYMCSDGFADQLGGKRDRRMGSRRFKSLLKKSAHLPFDSQRDTLLQAFNEYKGENERQDDVTVVGFGF